MVDGALWGYVVVAFTGRVGWHFLVFSVGCIAGEDRIFGHGL